MQIDWSAPVPDMPSNCLTRAGTHLSMARLGFRDTNCIGKVILSEDRSVMVVRYKGASYFDLKNS